MVDVGFSLLHRETSMDNVVEMARSNLHLNREEFALLIDEPVSRVEEWESGNELLGGALMSLFTLLTVRPQCAEVLVETRTNALPVGASHKEALGALARKLHGGHA
jgi:hypothetical protein